MTSAAILLLGTLALLRVPAPAQEGGPDVTALAGSGPVRAVVTIEHRGPGLPSVIRFRLDPPNAAGGGELLTSISKRSGLYRRRVLQPLASGAYEEAYVFPEGGPWFFYVRFGPGQAGFVSFFRADVTPEAGRVDTFESTFQSAFARVPGFVLPLGYAAFGLIGALALVGVAAILAWLHRQPRSAPAP